MVFSDSRFKMQISIALVQMVSQGLALSLEELSFSPQSLRQGPLYCRSQQGLWRRFTGALVEPNPCGPIIYPCQSYVSSLISS